MAALYFADALLSKIWCLGLRPAACMLDKLFAQAAIKECSVWLGMGSIHVMLLSISWRHI